MSDESILFDVYKRAMKETREPICKKCNDTGKYEDRRTLIRMNCDQCMTSKIKMKTIEWGSSND